ncbi:Scp1p KNAG_0E00200 [Huiozyma naganishii CBS 8797]|uniref:Calponin-homology (CH) domain-containing protein n=1 Tax=Huiozyma naganishii (strain ATCC MYA-139 / BCRC 22969 / CBS 8797 / KCTC 17520 / NBRC 10181 / NCYC 3082 / Yp74L-3) TaxID=1071383 RepID=J7RL98_HUIN7|nr:hypothetical protein KNAG_0E00200 [Kazachstania naganishii CBS 8797]CCK70288.1 hypothetical protein KNAG_0E00200 [Kazachstania naganishii CBS 8797]
MNDTEVPEVTSLDHDLQVLRSGKFSPEDIDAIGHWVFVDVLQEDGYKEGSDLLEKLKDGTVLCRIANILAEHETTTYPLIKWKESPMPFVQMEQISQFLVFASRYGVPQDELFQTVDLFEKKDAASVYQALKSLSRYANKKHPERFPVLGPQLVEKRIPPKVKRKPDHLRDAQWSTHEYGYMGGASQGSENVVFGHKRDIV